MPPQRFEPPGKCLAKERNSFLAAVEFTVECRPPFDKGAIAFDDRRDPQRRLKIARRYRRLASERVGLRVPL
jgi:hypothetical protein